MQMVLIQDRPSPYVKLRERHTRQDHAIQMEKVAEIGMAKQKAMTLDPAPTRSLSDGLLRISVISRPMKLKLDFRALARVTNGKYIRQAKAYGKGIKRIINKAGEKGTYLFNGCYLKLIPGYPVKAIDTTAAGDTINAVFGVSW